jgi:putative ABC transport system permease protein
MNPRQPDLDGLDQEIRDHIDAETEDNIGRGMTEEDARYAALRKFGNPARVKEDVRGVWVPRWADQLRQDLRDAARRIKRQPAFASLVILTLALGIGLTTAVYSVVNAVLVRPLSIPDPERLVWLTTYEPVAGFDIFNAIDFVEWKEQAPSLETAVAYGFSDGTFAGPEEAVRARVASVTEGFWELMGAMPAIGRFPRADDQRPLVVSHRFFVDRLGGDPRVIGRPVTLDGEQATIVGVLPADALWRLPLPFWRFGLIRRDPEMFRPLELQPKPYPANQYNVLGIGKLKREATLSGLQAEVEAIHARAVSGVGPPWDRLQPRVRPLQEEIVGGSRSALTLLLGAVLILLAITCANVANLLLARASARQREIALRMSVGGGPLRILRQLFFESVTFAALGGVAGVALSYGLLNVVMRVASDAVPRLSEATVDANVLVFAAVVSVATAFLFGLGPAVALCRTDVQAVLKSGVRHVSASRSTIRAGKFVVSLQLALTLLLLAGAGLMLKSVWRMTAHPPGFHPAQLLTMRVDFTGAPYREPERRQAFTTAALTRVAAVSGVRDVAITTGGDLSMLIIEEGKPADLSQPGASFSGVSAGFAPMLGMQLIRGRWLAEQEPEGAVLVNETVARMHFSGVDPIGRRIRVPSVGKTQVHAPIVGVVADLKYSKIDADPGPEVFVHYAYARAYLSGITMTARTMGDPLASASDVRAAVAGVDPSQSVYDVETMEQSLARSIAPRRFNMMLLIAFAAVAVFLAALGIYGVVAFAVAERTNEIGIRMALGAQRARVVRMIVAQGMTSVVAGIIIGLVAAMMATRLIAGLLYGVEATDVPTFAIATVTLAVIALLACCAPALKAALVDPVIALRAE